MELESSYQLLGVLRDDGIRTYGAVEIASGQPLQVHLFAKSDSEADRLLFKSLRALPVSKRRELLDMGMEGDSPYVVTEKLSDNVTAREWFSRLAGLAPAKASNSVTLAGSWKTGTPIPDELIRASQSSIPPKPPPPVARPEDLSPDYTRVMRLPDAMNAIQPEAPAAPPLQATGYEDPDGFLLGSEPSAELDEFDRMFGPSAPVAPPPPRQTTGAFKLPTPPPPPAQPVAAPPPAAPPPIAASPTQPAPKEPGEFTQMFLATKSIRAVTPVEPAPPPPPPAPEELPPPPVFPPVAADQPGEFTRSFLAAKPPEPEPPVVTPEPVPPPATQAVPPPVADDQPGEFTRSFLAPKPSQAVPPVVASQPSPIAPVPPPPVTPSGGASEFTRTFLANLPPEPPSIPSQPEPPAPPPVQSAPAPPVPPPTPEDQPGEFTRMFLATQTPEAKPPAVTPPPATPPPAPPKPVAPPPAAPPPPIPSMPANQPGDFTSQFLASQPGSSPRQTPAASEPGEFTSQFLAPKSSQPPAGAPPPLGLGGNSSQPGSFTSQFRVSQPPAQTATPPSSDESTRLFQAPSATSPPPLQARPNVPPPMMPVQGQPVEVSGEEPTRMFQVAPPGPPAKEPGEFTKMFPSLRPESGGTSHQPPPPEEPSEFTKFFQSPIHPTPAGNQRAPSTPQSGFPVGQPINRPNARGSEFTQMFGTPNQPPSRGTAPPVQPLGPSGGIGSGGGVGPSSATGAFSTPKPAGFPPPRSSSPSMGAGEFTRMMSASAPPTLGQPSGLPSAPPPPEPKPKSMLWLYIGGGALVLVLILIAMFFALRTK